MEKRLFSFKLSLRLCASAEKNSLPTLNIKGQALTAKNLGAVLSFQYVFHIAPGSDNISALV
ncbi:hypothetical protein ES708_34682 [subsurface metagenome]